MDPAKIEQMSAEFEIHSTKALGEAKRAEANADNALAKAGDRAGFWNVVDKLFTHMEVPKHVDKLFTHMEVPKQFYEGTRWAKRATSVAIGDVGYKVQECQTRRLRKDAFLLLALFLEQPKGAPKSRPKKSLYHLTICIWSRHKFRFANPTSSEDAVVNRCNPLDTPANSSMSGKELLAASTEKLEKLMGLVVQMDL
eukprot:g4101.t1